MAKIPSQIIKQINLLTNDIESLTEELRSLTRVVNEDNVQWHNISIPITEAIRQQVIDEYAAIKVSLKEKVNSLP